MIIETEGGGTGPGEGGESGRRRGGQERVPPSHCRCLWFSLLLVSFTTVYVYYRHYVSYQNDTTSLDETRHCRHPYREDGVMNVISLHYLSDKIQYTKVKLKNHYYVYFFLTVYIKFNNFTTLK